MQAELTKEQRLKFVDIILRDSLLTPGEINPTHFYETFMDFIDNNEIEMEEANLDKTEKELFKYCVDRGYIGITKLATITGNNKEKLFSAIRKTAPRVFYQFILYKEEYKNLSISELAEKYGSNIPGGWIANYCTCGTFYPISNEINIHMTENIYQPTEIALEAVDSIDVMSDNVLRFNMFDGIVFECVILRAARSSSVLELLEKCL